MILNLDETNFLLNSDKKKEYFQELLRLLRDASVYYTLLTVLFGTHLVDLFEQVKISQCKFVDIELSLFELEASKEFILVNDCKPTFISCFTPFRISFDSLWFCRKIP